MPKSENPTSDEVSKPPVADDAAEPESTENITKISADPAEKAETGTDDIENTASGVAESTESTKVAKSDPNSDEANPKSEATEKKTAKKSRKTQAKSEKVDSNSDQKSIKIAKKDKKAEKPTKSAKLKAPFKSPDASARPPSLYSASLY